MTSASHLRSLRHFKDLRPADLANRKILTELYRESARAGIWPNRSAHDVLDFMSLAAKAVRDDTFGTPGVLFWHLLGTDARDRITGAHEKTALMRWASQERHDLFEDVCGQNNPRGKVHTSVPAVTYDPDYEELRGYHHSYLLQCPFPQKPLAARTNIWRSRHGQRMMIVRSGFTVVDDSIVHREVPCGSMPRIILPYIFAQAIRYGRFVCMGRTLHEFMRQTGYSTGSKNYRSISRQALDLACSTISLHEIADGRGGVDVYKTATVPIASKLEHGPMAPEGLTISPESASTADSAGWQWNSNIIISEPLFDLITENPVPLNIRHLARLTRSPRRMDLYSWLSYRTFYVSKTVHIPLARLHPIFGTEIRCTRAFKYRIRKDLAAICAVHPYNVGLDGNDLVIRKSKHHPCSRRSRSG